VMSGVGLLAPVLREVSPGSAPLIASTLELSVVLLLTAGACSVELWDSPRSALLRASACGLPAPALGLPEARLQGSQPSQLPDLFSRVSDSSSADHDKPFRSCQICEEMCDLSRYASLIWAAILHHTKTKNKDKKLLL